jgi:hypothetical protein
MNTLMHAMAALACIWMSIQFFTTWNQEMLGVVSLGLFFWFVVTTLMELFNETGLGRSHDDEDD